MKTLKKQNVPRKIEEQPVETFADARREFVAVYWAIRRGQLSPGAGNSAVNALRGFVQTFEAERGSTLNVRHSGDIGIRAADECFNRVFGGAETPPAPVPDQLAQGPEPVEDLEQG